MITLASQVVTTSTPNGAKELKNRKCGLPPDTNYPKMKKHSSQTNPWCFHNFEIWSQTPHHRRWLSPTSKHRNKHCPNLFYYFRLTFGHQKILEVIRWIFSILVSLRFALVTSIVLSILFPLGSIALAIADPTDMSFFSSTIILSFARCQLVSFPQAIVTVPSNTCCSTNVAST